MAEPWDTLRALFPDNTEGLIQASSMRTQVDLLETEDLDNVKVSELETVLVEPLTNLDTTFWKGQWDNNTTYEKGQMVVDDGWLMVANKQTTEKAAPTPIGDPVYLYDGTGMIDQQAVDVKQLVYGTRYTATQAFYLNGYRLEVVAGNFYEVVLVRDPNGAAQATFINAFTAVQSGWREFGVVAELNPAGIEFDLIVIVSVPDPAPVEFTYQWTYITPGGGVPLSGQCVHGNNTTDRLQFHYLDQGGVDRSAFLQSLLPGDFITSQGVQWAVQAVVDDPGSSQVSVFVAPATQAPADGVQSFVFEVPAPQTITYAVESDYWLGNPNRAGLYVEDDSFENVVPNDNAYGTDIYVQEVNLSDDWEAMAATTAGSGQTSFTPSYDYDKTVAFVVPSATYSEVSRLTTDDRAAGTYEVKMSLTYALTTALRSAFFRFSTDGGTTWNEWVSEPADSTDVVPLYYAYPFEHQGGPLEIIFQSRLEQAGDSLTVNFLDLIFERVG